MKLPAAPLPRNSTDEQHAAPREREPGAAALPHHDCPLCGKPNDCAAACSGDLAAPCWCRDATFTPALLARVPADARGRACICAACAAAGA
jgi:hypothetical protein